MWKTDDPRSAERHVYFIEAEGTGLVKIGVANCAHSRLKSLDQMSAVPLRLIGCVVTDMAGSLEKDLHSRFAEHRARGEWFRFALEIAAYVADSAFLPPIPRYGPGGAVLKPGQARPLNGRSVRYGQT